MMRKLRTIVPFIDMDMSEILKGASASFMFRVGGAVTQFLFSILLARLFGAEGLGIYMLALSLTFIASNVGRWGVDQAALKYIAICADKGEWGKLSVIFGKSAMVVTSISLIVSLLLYLASEWLSLSVFKDASARRSLRYDGRLAVQGVYDGSKHDVCHAYDQNDR